MDVLDWNPEAGEIGRRAGQVINLSQDHNQRLAHLELSGEHVDEALKLISDDIYLCSSFHSYCFFLSQHSSDRRIREEARSADRLMSDYVRELNRNREVYDRISGWRPYIESRSTEDLCFIDRVLRGYERNGILLSTDDRERFSFLRFQTDELTYSITEKWHHFDQLIGISVEDSADLPPEMVARLPMVSEKPKKYGIPLRKAVYMMAMKNFASIESRRKLEMVMASWCHEHVADLLQLVRLRHEMARLRGFSNYAEMELKKYILKNPVEVRSFLNNLLAESQRSFNRELRVLQKIKRLDGGSDEICSWDLNYLVSRWKKEYGFDQQIVKEYLPRQLTIERIGEFLHETFRVQMVELTDEILWHPTVRKYAFRYEDRQMGTAYFDLFTRSGKVKTTGCFGLRSSAIFPFSNGRKIDPVICLTMSMNRTEKLMTHTELAAFLHELGHVLHYLFRDSKYALLNSVSLEPEFVEVPSRIFFHLAWNRDFLKRISSHYQTKGTLPPEVIDKIVKTRSIDIGLTTRKKVFMSIFDQLLNASPKFIELIEGLKTSEQMVEFIVNTHHQLFSQIVGSSITPNQGVIFPQSWMAYTDSDNFVFTDLYSEVIACDLSNRYLANRRYCELFTSLYMAKTWHSSRELVERLLGREPSLAEFVRFYQCDYDTERMSIYLPSEHFPLPEPDDEESDFEVENYFTEIDTGESHAATEFRFLRPKDSDRPIPDYVSENTETLKRYRSIFTQNEPSPT